jgi:hypothetical protein
MSSHKYVYHHPFDSLVAFLIKLLIGTPEAPELFAVCSP